MTSHPSNKGVASGLATLGSGGTLTTAQIPATLATLTDGTLTPEQIPATVATLTAGVLTPAQIPTTLATLTAGVLTPAQIPTTLATLTAGKLTTGQIPTALASLSQGTAVADVAALTAVAATGEDAPTEAEYNALLADVTAIRATLLALQNSLQAAGLIAP